jgi:hypothetical protein
MSIHERPSRRRWAQFLHEIDIGAVPVFFEQMEKAATILSWRRAQAVSWKISRPISMRRISEVPAPIS